jgi:hypothetical protein
MTAQAAFSPASTAVRLIGWHGDVADLESAIAFANEFYEVVAASGIPVDTDPFDSDLVVFGYAGRYAVNSRRVPQKGVGDHDSVGLIVCVFVALHVAEWALDQALTSLWQRLAPPLSRLVRAMTGRKEGPSGAGSPQGSASIMLRTIFGPDQVVVEVEIPPDALEPEAIVRLVSDAHARAAEGVPVNQLVLCRVLDGDLDSKRIPLEKR